MKFSDKLRDRYAEEIEAWHWDELERVSDNNPQFDEGGDVVCMAWIGTATAIMPSGKIYAPWTTNQTARDMIRDRAFMDVLEHEIEDRGFCLVEYGGELYLSRMIDDGRECFFFDGSTFTRRGETVAKSEAELEALMESEGYFPGVYSVNDRGDILGYYQFEREIRNAHA